MHPRALLITAAVVASVAAGCGGDDASDATLPVTAAMSEVGIVQPVAAVGAGLTVTATDACELVTADDVATAFGGDAGDGRTDGDGGCAFSLSGDTVLGELSGAAVDVHVLLSPDGYLTVDEQSASLPDLEAIDGLGDEAWYTAFNRELHIDLGGTDLIVIGAPGDAVAGRDAVLALGRAILVRLDATSTAAG